MHKFDGFKDFKCVNANYVSLIEKEQHNSPFTNQNAILIEKQIKKINFSI